MRTAFNCLLLLAISLDVAAQVRIDRAIVLEGSADADRQIIGIAPSLAADDLINAEVELAGTYRTSSPTPGPLWTVDLPGLQQEAAAGTHIMVRSPEPASGPVSVSLNGSMPIELRIGPNMPLMADEVPEGSMLSLVHDGQVFQVLNGTAHSRRSCPGDMVALNPLTCIEPDERLNKNFYDAALECGQLNRRLCSWGEIHVACQMRDSLGLANMLGNWEWTGSGADHDFNLRVVGLNDCIVVSRLNGGTTTNRFRCCSTR